MPSRDGWKRFGHFFFSFFRTHYNLFNGGDFVMKTYNVAEIAKLLNVNKETVRRWIRSGQLKSTQKSKRDGNVIDELDLFEFVQTKPKYRNMVGVPELQISNTYISEELNCLLNDLIYERDKLNDEINKVQKIIKEL